jgi:hypothetical protein
VPARRVDSGGQPESGRHSAGSPSDRNTAAAGAGWGCLTRSRPSRAGADRRPVRESPDSTADAVESP